MTLLAATLTDSVKALALELGFDLVTTGPATPPEHGAALRQWLEAGYAGTMGYLNGSGMDRRFFHALGASRLDRTICSSAGAAGIVGDNVAQAG